MDRTNHIDQLVRLIADDEATAEQRAEFERLVQSRPELISAAEAEGRLRSAVGRVMVAEAAKSRPADLESRLRHAADGAGSPAARRDRRRSSLAFRGVGAVRHALRRNIVPSGLAAGILILVTAAIIAGLLSRSPSAPWSPYGDPADNLVNVFVDAHRWSVDHPAAWNKGIEFRTYDDVRAWLEQSCEGAAPLPDLESHGYEFVGAMRLSDALHMRFASETTGADVSFYIQNIDALDDRDTLTLEPGVAYQSVGARSPEAGTGRAKRSFLWISGDCIYVLVNGDNLETSIALARGAGMPAGEIRDF